ncbi:MAG: NADPH-dependent F420 reductase [Acidobacteria bacterium]|nr:NADPH-dependent F420 reductase [Acidobacteriota bacterium]
MRRAIAILGGTGALGQGLALRWARAGEEVIIGSRDRGRAQAAAQSIVQLVGPSALVSGMENSAACARTKLCVLTVPFGSQAALLKELKAVLQAGTVLIDATVPLAASVGGRATRVLGVWQGSAAQQSAELVPPGVSVVAAFHNISSDTLHRDAAVECDSIICSDDEQARKIASELAEKIPGVRAIDGGKLENARIVEQITALLIALNTRYKTHGAGIRITGIL